MFLNQNTDCAKNLKKAVQIAQQKKEQSFFVFDVDSTLLCMKYRTQAIIRDCENDPSFAKPFSKHLEALQKVKVTERDWSVREVLYRYGFSKEMDLLLAVEKIWKKKFFSSEYLHLDQPYKGCTEFIQHISQQGVELYYLTARNHERTREGTIESFKKWNFPLKSENHLIMKKASESDLTDAEYKVKHLKNMIKQTKTVVFFENEPLILNKSAKEVPEVRLFWMNSTHSRQAQPPKTALPLNMSYVWQ